ncbi:DUF1284 domain-containing protein [Candidatus Solincola sp.]|nr:DUF1284 domain-containing protein [Actinomycetota bacterium]MDI7253430.1 DUF1284 domain-containing protein [Actinomycetota bacterium]
MESAGAVETMRLRPHHLFCSRFLPLELLMRGEGFARVVEELKLLTEAESEAVVLVNEGPDQVCEYCPDYADGRCRNPVGDEEKVRKWDQRVLDGLGLSYGQKLTVRDLQALVEEKAPLDFCRDRCPWKSVCSVFARS